MANASRKHGMGHGQTVGHPTTGIVDDNLPEQEDVITALNDRNPRHGADQGRTHNQRHSVADETNAPPDTEEFVERHQVGIRSKATGLTDEQIEKLANKP